ncbi:MAG: hypothetical protein QOE53_2946, partial [Pseudonocardiales bacterium]|nr:hypothetical protein [Pseudonocardiales bacterium]
LFDYLDWQAQTRRTMGSTVVRFSERRGAAPATQNRRIAAVRGLFEFAVITGVVQTSPVPAAADQRVARPPRPVGASSAPAPATGRASGA